MAKRKAKTDTPPFSSLFLHIIAPALNTLVGGPSKLYEGSRAQIQGAIEGLVQRAVKSGDVRKDLVPFDLVRALIGVSYVASSPDWKQSARRLVDILITFGRSNRPRDPPYLTVCQISESMP